MKQHITKEQWDELNDDQKVKFWKSLGIVNSPEHILEKKNWHFGIDIGRMIKFLREEEKKGNFDTKTIKSYVLTPEMLCDLLWETVKYKLKKDSVLSRIEKNSCANP